MWTLSLSIFGFLSGATVRSSSGDAQGEVVPITPAPYIFAVSNKSEGYHTFDELDKIQFIYEPVSFF
ncbi:hypothetical protein L5515_005431 [Caenorhabditis briggsae]|uniref:Uncharacterized protein n=1 Tax=Caenorhabditis briggsae TaxID=6238 RepID=A0AAE9JD99_CAEBR|nr:hypothetical protein L5515_005431 [Caenorhabditis briggsae]